jgi:molybdopterin-guanine dinucleotide biosynthesis protein A
MSAPAGIRVNAVLLAGGKSERMGRDKASLDFQGEPLWRRQIALLRELEPREIFISGPAREEWSGFRVVPDFLANAGPLAGLAASLRVCADTHLLALAVDLPRMTAGYLRSLIHHCTAERGVVPGDADFLEPLAAIYPTTCLPLAESCLASGELAMHDFVARCVEAGLMRVIPVAASERPLFFNANTPADLADTGS